VKLSAVSSSLGRTYFHGITADSNQLVTDVGYGNLQVYDRFISARSFGQKKRVIYCSEDGLIDEKYVALYEPRSRVWYIITSINYDYLEDERIGATYSVTQADYLLDVYKYSPTSYLLSGQPEAYSKTILKSGVHADIERITAETSTELDTVKYSTHLITVTEYVPDVDDEIVDTATNEVYEVREVQRLMRSTEIRCVKRG